MGGLGWMRSSWGLWGKEEGVGQDLEQERLGPSCSGHGGGAKHSQTAFKQS